MNKLLKILGLGILAIPVQLIADSSGADGPPLSLSDCEIAARAGYDVCEFNARNILNLCNQRPEGCANMDYFEYLAVVWGCMNDRDTELINCFTPPPPPPTPLPPIAPVIDYRFSPELDPARTVNMHPSPVMPPITIMQPSPVMQSSPFMPPITIMQPSPFIQPSPVMPPRTVISTSTVMPSIRQPFISPPATSPTPMPSYPF